MSYSESELHQIRALKALLSRNYHLCQQSYIIERIESSTPDNPDWVLHSELEHRNIPIMIAAACPHQKQVYCRLLERNTEAQLTYRHPKNNNTALDLAFSRGRLDAIIVLIAYGADYHERKLNKFLNNHPEHQDTIDAWFAKAEYRDSAVAEVNAIAQDEMDLISNDLQSSEEEETPSTSRFSFFGALAQAFKRRAQSSQLTKIP